ncbi:MAG: hypothetical protein SPL61_11185 [Saccharofermentans sp.]|nr:hypothetical protein [Saccharofermentans sp.]
MSSMCSYVMKARGNEDNVLAFFADIFDGCSALVCEEKKLSDVEMVITVDNYCNGSLEFEFGYQQLINKTAEHQVVFSAESFNDADEFSENLFFDRGISLINQTCEYHEFWKDDCEPEEWHAFRHDYNQSGNHYECDGDCIKVVISAPEMPDIENYAGITGREM